MKKIEMDKLDVIFDNFIIICFYLVSLIAGISCVDVFFIILATIALVLRIDNLIQILMK